MSGNGTVKMFGFVGSIIGSIMAIILAVYSTVYSPLQAAQKDEVKCRQEGDKEILVFIDKSFTEQRALNNKLLETMGEIRSDIKFLRMRRDNG